jgi:hypothetical protein
MLGYQLFDMLVSVNNGGRDPLELSIPRMVDSTPPNLNLERLLSCLQDWTSVIPAAQNAASINPQGGVSSLIFQESTTQKTKWMITNLLQASRQDSRAEWHRILSNLHSMAFFVHWYSMVRS